MEAQLIIETPNNSGSRRPAQDPNRDTLTRRLDAYLQAAGAQDELLRRRLALRTLDELEDEESDLAEVPWAKVIATLDAVLNAALTDLPSSHRGMQGRIALKQGSERPAVRDWGTPLRRRCAMPASDLAPWRPSLRELVRLPVPRAALGLAACLCWLAVLVLP